MASLLSKSPGTPMGELYQGNGGFSGLWKGFGARVFMIGTLTGLQWFIYDTTKVAFGLKTGGGKKETKFEHETLTKQSECFLVNFFYFFGVPTNHSEQRKKLFTTRTSNNHHSLTYKCSSKNIHIQLHNSRQGALHYEIQLVWSEILG